MNYIYGITRSDIIFAVNQCEEYSVDTKQSHGESVKMIVRYLNKTKDKGLVFTPDGSNELEFYTDSDFSGAKNRTLGAGEHGV